MLHVAGLASLVHAPAAPLGPGGDRLVVVTDVDDTIRHASGRCIEQTTAAVRELKARDIPVVLVSERPATELRELQAHLDLADPFICEGGAELHLPVGYFNDAARPAGRQQAWEAINVGTPRRHLREALARVAQKLGARVITPGEGTQQFTEPFWLVDPRRRLRARVFRAMRTAGFRCVAGKRFDYATGVQDPSQLARVLISLYRTCNQRVIVVGLGDRWQDLPWLREVDVPVVVRNESLDQQPILRQLPAAYVTSAPGPDGWCQVLLGDPA